MKLIATVLALAVLGFGSSYALAKGKPPRAGTETTTTAATTTAAGHGHGRSGKVTLCHKAGKSGRWVKITVGPGAQKAHLKHGDVLPDASGNCPAPAPRHGTTSTATTTEASS